MMFFDTAPCEQRIINEHYKKLVELTSDGVIQYTFEEEKILFVNQGLINIFDLQSSASELENLYLTDVLHFIKKNQKDRELLDKYGEIHGTEYYFKTLKQEDRWVIDDSFIIQIPSTGEKVVYSIIRDITERKKIEENIHNSSQIRDNQANERTFQLENACQELEAFSYSVSHEMRNYLTKIRGNVSLLQNLNNDRLNPQYRLLAKIDKNICSLSGLIDHLYDFSRVSWNELRKQKVDLSGLAMDIVDHLKNSQPCRDVNFRIKQNMVVEGDPHLLEIVISNLLQNAWKYTSSKSFAAIEFDSMHNGKTNIYYVKDNGVGFNMDVSNRMFMPFQRFHPSSEFEGTGIGLATVKRIIVRHGGAIWAEGKENEGATFFFTL